MKPSVAGALCGRHPTVAAVDICTRCGTFLCAECIAYGKNEQPFCLDCLSVLATSSSASRRSTVGLGLSIGGVTFMLLGPAVPFWGVLFWPVAALAGVAGLVVSWVELRAIARGEAPLAGKGRARAGRILGFVHLALVAIAGALVVFAVRHFRDT